MFHAVTPECHIPGMLVKSDWGPGLFGKDNSETYLAEMTLTPLRSGELDAVILAYGLLARWQEVFGREGSNL